MCINQVNIRKNGEEDYVFSYYKDGTVKEIESERCDIVRFIDESIDTLLRKTNKMSSESFCTPYMGQILNRVIIEAFD